MAQKYDNDSIDMLIGAERIRKRPASMLGSSGLDGARHGFTEIYGNALDEVSSGFGGKLEVKYYKDGSVSLRDYGRGVPLGWNNRRKNWNWHVIYNELYGGGKYNNGQWYMRSIDKWSEWKVSDLDFAKEVYDDLGVDVAEVPDDGQIYRYSDIDIMRIGDTIKLKVNNLSWASATWEILNKRLNYLASVGLNGLGAASTQYTSEYFEVRSYRDGKCITYRYEHGMPIINGEAVNMFDGSFDVASHNIEDHTEDTAEENGTFIHWKPDSLVFSDVNIGGDWLLDVCEDIANVANVDLHFEDENTGKILSIKAGGLKDGLELKCGSDLIRDDNDETIALEANGFNHGNIVVEGQPFTWVCKVDVVLGYAKEKSFVSCFHNSVKMKSGAHYDGARIAISDFFNSQASRRGIKLEYSDYENIFSVMVSAYSNYASIRNQTKDKVEDTFVLEIVRDTIFSKLEMEFAKGNKELSKAVDRVINEAQTRIAIKQAAKEIREAKKAVRQKDPDKFHTCKAYMRKDYSITELWITEGDSAQGAVDSARNSDFQATFPVRGKCLNVLKSSLDKILKNEEIKGIFALLGTGMDIGHEGLFDIRNLKFDKIIFATDADEDGFQIRVLLFLIFYKLAPQLITEGHVYIAETPRFEVTLTDGSKYYARDDEERDKLKSEYEGRIRKISRFKGLGEVDAEILRATTVAPETRNLVRLDMDLSDNNLRDLFDSLFGMDKYHQRKKILTTILGEDVAELMTENALLLDEIENSDIDEGIEYQVV